MVAMVVVVVVSRFRSAWRLGRMLMALVVIVVIVAVTEADLQPWSCKTQDWDHDAHEPAFTARSHGD